jgi:hypothetical protein
VVTFWLISTSENVCGTQVNVAFLFVEVLVMMCLLPCKLVFEWIVRLKSTFVFIAKLGIDVESS